MKAFSIHSDTKEVKEIEIEMKANTTYSFFNSILIDESQTLSGHLVFTDANALSQNKKACFLGEQLLLGDALVIGRNGLEESDATIPAQTLSELMNYEVPRFYADALSLLAKSDINLYREFSVTRGDAKLALNCEWTLYAFNEADDKTKDYFLAQLTRTLEANASVEEYVRKMAQLAINAGN
jgi:hypothetical protein